MRVRSLLFFEHFPNKPWFLPVCSTSLLKTQWKKEKLLATSNFSFSQCLLLVSRTFCHFYQIQNCHLEILSIWTSLKFVVWERVKKAFKYLALYSTDFNASTTKAFENMEGKEDVRLPFCIHFSYVRGTPIYVTHTSVYIQLKYTSHHIRRHTLCVRYSYAVDMPGSRYSNGH